MLPSKKRASTAKLVTVLVLLTGCGGVTDSGQLGPEVRDPAQVRTPEGAVAAYHGTRYAFRDAFHSSVLEGALLTDEFGSNRYGQPGLTQSVMLDRRDLPEGAYYERGLAENKSSYELLHLVRQQATQAIGLLATYAPDLSPALRAHAYALAGYAEVLLADLFCSGIPLSTVDFDADFTYRPGATTAEVYDHAIASFDTAVTLAADSARILSLAQVGRGRALLALGRYAEAGQAVAGVPDDFSYSVLYDAQNEHNKNFMPDYFNSSTVFAEDGNLQPGATMTDREGDTGLDYLSSGDPRVAGIEMGTTPYGFSIFRPAKYAADGAGPMVVADGIEARLIEAEAALHAGTTDIWLGKLNALRQTIGLADTTDPGTVSARVDLLFRERAFWLFLTGHRQGDLRRLVREYKRNAVAVYPSGTYPGGQDLYGTDVTVPIPSAERLNPYFTGCFGRGA